MRKWIEFIFIICICYAIVPGCHQNDEQNHEKMNAKEGEENSESLNIFIVSDAVHTYSESEDKEGVFYTTFTAMGEYFGIPTEFGEEGFIYHDVIEKYQEETGLLIHVQWFQWPELMEAELETLNENQKPDLIISTFTSTSDYYRYLNEGMFYDLTSLFEQNEIYTGNQYYNQVLKGGEFEQKQYIVPLLFNVDTVMGSEETWNEASLHLEEVESHPELLDTLIYAQKQGNMANTVFQYNSISGSYLPYMVYGAAGEKWIDYENWTVNLDEERFSQMCTFYEQFLREQFEDGLIQKVESIPWVESKEMHIKNSMVNEIQIDQFLEEIGCVMQGGGAFQTYLHSAAAQAWYYESRYSDLKETFKIAAMPSERGNTTAHISYFGAVLNSAEDPEKAFNFLKYLMDTEVPPFFGLSVNKENTEKQLDYLTSTAYRMRPGLKARLEDGTVSDSVGDYVIQPMSEETRGALETIIDGMDVATMPNWPVYAILEKELQNYVKGEVRKEEAYQHSLDRLNEYLNLLNKAEKEDDEEEKVSGRTYSIENSQIEEEERMEKHHDLTENMARIMVGLVTLAVVIMVIMKISRTMRKRSGKEKHARVQIASIDKSNGEAERNVRMTQGSQFGLGSSLGRGTAEMVYLTVYQLDKKNKILKLKLPQAYSKEMNEGDMGDITYVGEEVLSFKRTGSIKDEDQKRVKFRM